MRLSTQCVPCCVLLVSGLVACTSEPIAWLREASRGKKLVKSNSASHIVDDEAGKMEGKTEVCPIL
jgi:hypothetical protein